MNLRTYDVVALAEAYRVMLGKDTVNIDLAGLEPTLWHEFPNRKIPDLVKSLTDIGVRVGMTTNGNQLNNLAPKLAAAGLTKCRVSVHSFDKTTYARITGSDSLQSVIQGIDACLKSGIEVAVNRTLLNGYLDDIPQALEFISRRNLTLKLYELWWVPRTSATWPQYYIHWKEVIDKYVLPLVKSTERRHYHFNRHRDRYTNRKSVECIHAEAGVCQPSGTSLKLVVNREAS